MARDWTDEENDTIVADYFSMLSADVASKPYNKSEHNRAICARIDRTRSSVEYKHQNISAVLKAVGEDWIPGYKPAFNYQSALEDAVLRWLSSNPGWLSPVNRSPRTMQGGFQDEEQLFVGPPPTLRNAPEPEELEKTLSVARRLNVAQRDESNRALGRAGENRVLAHERSTLIAAGRTDLADDIRWVSDDEGDGAGYDILSFDTDGHERLLEVKTTNGWERTPFHITRNELRVAENRRDNWVLFRLYSFARKPAAFEIRPPLESHIQLTPSTFQASIR